MKTRTKGKNTAPKSRSYSQIFKKPRTSTHKSHRNEPQKSLPVVEKAPVGGEVLTGKLSLNTKGFGFVTPEGKLKGQEDVFIMKADLNTAMNGDTVEVQLYNAAAAVAGKAREGKILQVKERANNRIVGIFSASQKFGFVSPDDTRIKSDVYIPGNKFLGAVTGSKVVAEITQWPEKNLKAEGKIVEVIGQSGEPGVDILSIMRQYDLAEEFPEAVQQAADAVEATIDGDAYVGKNGREDRRHLKIVTIDGEDAKDLDDGVYAEQREDGSFFLGVYIADVSWYVRENQPLDVEAEARGTSVYLVDRVVPMLPRALSNGICSLNADVDRLSMACEMEISPEGKVTSYKILPVVIHVYRRLTYTLVNKILVEHDKDFVMDNQDIVPFLETLQNVRNAMYKYRHRRGSINFEIPEIKVKLDENGKAVGLKKRVGNLGESIVEQCMLAANETVAEHMCRKKVPFVYRVHEEPEESKITALNGLLSTFGLHLKADSQGSIKPKELQKALEKIEGGPAEKIVSTVALRSMQQARYAADNLGHFGLAAEYYTHFTSPIRRYPDLLVHRQLRASFGKEALNKEQKEKLYEKLSQLAEHASQRERIAVAAERDTTDLKKVEYMQQFVGETFEGIISSVTGFGIFIELDNGVEGLVHITALQDDYYDFVESQYALVGTHHHRRYQLGDPVQVVLVRADIEAKSLDFVVKDNCDAKVLEMAQRGEVPNNGPRGGSSSTARAKVAPQEGTAKKKPAAHKPTGRKKPNKKRKAKAQEASKAKENGKGPKSKAKVAQKHKHRKGKRQSIIADINPLQI